MSIAAGTKLGRYEIRSKIGEGGMGEVYLAHDEQLDRTVALKILSAEIARDQQRLYRFLQEARAASKLKRAPMWRTSTKLARSKDITSSRWSTSKANLSTRR